MMREKKMLADETRRMSQLKKSARPPRFRSALASCSQRNIFQYAALLGLRQHRLDGFD
jgi:hypothetical protein